MNLEPPAEPSPDYGGARASCVWTSRVWTRLVMLGLLATALALMRQGTGNASSADGTLEPNGRGLQLLRAREAILLEQSARARKVARARGLMLYRLLRTAALERPVTDAPAPDVPPATITKQALATGDRGTGAAPGARAVALATAVVARDLAETRALRGELERVRAEREALRDRSDHRPASDAIPAAGVDGPAPSFLRPVAGSLVTPFGVGRDPATGAWIFRAAATFAAGPGEQVRSPTDGRVHLVAASVAGGAAVVLSHAEGGWTLVISGLDSVAVAAGETVHRGDPLGRARAAPGSVLRIEAWHGRTPVDPAAVLRAR